MVRHVWKNYERLAFGKDQLKPVSGKGVDSWGGVGQTLVDSLDTWLGRNMQFNCCNSPYKNRRWGGKSTTSHHTLPNCLGKKTWLIFRWLKALDDRFAWRVWPSRDVGRDESQLWQGPECALVLGKTQVPPLDVWWTVCLHWKGEHFLQ